jgi:hypothetical protein
MPAFERMTLTFILTIHKTISKTRRVREGGSTPMDVATNVILIQNEKPTNIQSKQDLKPSLWQLSSSDDILKLHNDIVNEFQSYKRNVQKQLLEQVLSTSFFEEESMEIKDDMSYYMSGENRGKCVCVKCSEIYPNSVSKCLKCGYIPNTITNKTILYEGVPSKHPDHPPIVKLG